MKGIGGFYYVKTADSVLECKAKGIFRKRGITPLAGDRVVVEGEEKGYVIAEIEERSNFFRRPPIANVDQFFLVVSAVDPNPNLLVIDRLTIICERKGIAPILLLTKTDLASAEEVKDIYSGIGYKVIDIRANVQAAVEEIEHLCKGKLSVFCGNSGVGKSTLLNDINPEWNLQTNGTSQKLGRGKHTTRAVELYEWKEGYLADTPGFSALDFERVERFEKEELADYFPEFHGHTDHCFFTGCSHRVEKGCEVLQALNEGLISPSRHSNYCYLYEEASKNDKYD